MLVATTATAIAVSTLMRRADSAEGPFGVAWPLSLTFLLLWLSSSLIARRLARPYVELERVARALGSGDTKARFRTPERAGVESRIIGDTINDMADRIAQQLSDQRALLAAVSHELRTPLARIRLSAELAREGDTAQLDRIDREVEELDALVGDLLAASRVDFGALNTRALDLRDLALAVVESARLPVERLEADGAAVVRGDATLLSRAMANLVANAERHGGGVVSVAVRVRDGWASFEVEDDGPGFAKDAIAHAFEPFRRGRSAASQHDHAGAGFGLSLVDRIAKSHGGTAWAENRAPSGARVGFRVRLETGVPKRA